MCEFCGPFTLNPGVAALWRKDFEAIRRDDPALAAYIERAADMLKEEIDADAKRDPILADASGRTAGDGTPEQPDTK